MLLTLPEHQDENQNQHETKEDKREEGKEFTSDKVREILEEEGLNFVSENGVKIKIETLEKYIVYLFEKKEINFEQMLKLSFKIGTIKFGEYLVLKDIIKQEFLNQLIKEQEKIQNKNIGEIIIERLVIKDLDIYRELHNLGIIKLGEFLIYKGDIKKQQLDKALKEKNEDIPIGEFLVKQGIISIDILIERLEELGIIKLGEVLIKKGIINKSELKKYLYEQKNTGKKLGNILIEKGELKPGELNTILFSSLKNNNIDGLNLSSMLVTRKKQKKERKEIEQNCNWRNAK